MTKITTDKLAQLLAAARATPLVENPAHAEEAVFKALLDATVYAHVPLENAPEGRMRFIQFVRPDNKQTVLPFFSDREQAGVASANRVAIVAMSGRRLFELTRGATLMLNPNIDQVALYPPEIVALLEGRPLGSYTQETLVDCEQVGVCPPAEPTDELVLALRDLFQGEATVRAAYLAEIHRGADSNDIFLLLTIVVPPAHKERLIHLISLTIQPVSSHLTLPLTVSCISPDASLPDLCNHGIQFYGT
ncbi:enhanced serine sensitivity protein SseB C-terminal domain-containing protein [Rhodanobacter denitrificans]|uniref:SseB protein n=1 Tax=Rhodanobacter denitrificans TaxID=666685 RepID=M4NGJ8_9GAMM|nr:enhanced serine sensitivity protein SseB C-terminal domain-containing protein [Rhodanobacter denitrificans]AGG88783.1 SseB protein [Rhodanobacter denitrificans]UJJ58551.1 enhanced serine sensitivity protein SseB C-terminal domain-containing protein [Rhodanobacter denitrificans]UJM87914.1 enhanced serine sensitivity protein SseB C-terminal domain-containing protein [Rhodanobacter denitrificans]